MSRHVGMGKHYCEYCRCWVQPDAVSVRLHNQGQRHKTSEADFLQRKRQERVEEQSAKDGVAATLRAMEAAAARALERDLAPHRYGAPAAAVAGHAKATHQQHYGGWGEQHAPHQQQARHHQPPPSYQQQHQHQQAQLGHGKAGPGAGGGGGARAGGGWAGAGAGAGAVAPHNRAHFHAAPPAAAAATGNQEEEEDSGDGLYEGASPAGARWSGASRPQAADGEGEGEQGLQTYLSGDHESAWPLLTPGRGIEALVLLHGRLELQAQAQAQAQGTGTGTGTGTEHEPEWVQAAVRQGKEVIVPHTALRVRSCAVVVYPPRPLSADGGAAPPPPFEAQLPLSSVRIPVSDAEADTLRAAHELKQQQRLKSKPASAAAAPLPRAPVAPAVQAAAAGAAGAGGAGAASAAGGGYEIDPNTGLGVWKSSAEPAAEDDDSHGGEGAGAGGGSEGARGTKRPRPHDGGDDGQIQGKGQQQAVHRYDEDDLASFHADPSKALDALVAKRARQGGEEAGQGKGAGAARHGGYGGGRGDEDGSAEGALDALAVFNPHGGHNYKGISLEEDGDGAGGAGGGPDEAAVARRKAAAAAAAEAAAQLAASAAAAARAEAAAAAGGWGPEPSEPAAAVAKKEEGGGAKSEGGAGAVRGGPLPTVAFLKPLVPPHAGGGQGSATAAAAAAAAVAAVQFAARKLPTNMKIRRRDDDDD